MLYGPGPRLIMGLILVEQPRRVTVAVKDCENCKAEECTVFTIICYI